MLSFPSIGANEYCLIAWFFIKLSDASVYNCSVHIHTTMSFKRKIKRGDRIYYDEVENVMVSGKVVQKHLRCIGTNPDKPTSFPIDHLHFGCIAMRLMQGDLSSNEILDMIEKV